jgi:hypothetical protein
LANKSSEGHEEGGQERTVKEGSGDFFVFLFSFLGFYETKRNGLYDNNDFFFLHSIFRGVGKKEIARMGGCMG